MTRPLITIAELGRFPQSSHRRSGCNILFDTARRLAATQPTLILLDLQTDAGVLRDAILMQRSVWEGRRPDHS